MRNLGLDLLRITAVLLVLGRHCGLPDNANPLLRAWHQGGWVGVDLFFVLSGFLVSSLMFREHQRTGQVDVKRFLIRRAFKIYPAFWFFLAVSVATFCWLGTPPKASRLIGELLFLQNYLGGVWNHTWSLAVEEHFYIGLAALFVFCIRRWPDQAFAAIPRIFTGIGLSCLALRLFVVTIHPEFSYRAYLFGTQIRIDSLFFGVFLSYLCQYRQLEEKLSFVPSWSLLLVGGMLLSPAFAMTLETSKWIATLGYAMFYLGSGAILLAALRLPESQSRALRFFGLLGAASYSIYLWHMPVNLWGWDLVRSITGWQSQTAYYLVYVVGSCLFGLAMSRVVEFPVLHLRDWLFPSAASAKSSSGVQPALRLFVPESLEARADGPVPQWQNQHPNRKLAA